MFTYFNSRMFIGVYPKVIKPMMIEKMTRKGMNEHSIGHVPGVAIPSGTQAQSTNMELCKK